MFAIEKVQSSVMEKAGVTNFTFVRLVVANAEFVPFFSTPKAIA